MSTQTETPMLKQYRQIKAQHQDCILFFRLGDFYEMFYEDARTASGVLDLVLTSRGKGTANHVPMCGIPFHSADNYIAKLIKSGFKVAICEQIEDPSAAKGIVRRDVVRVITSGTFLDDQSSDTRYIVCLCPDKHTTGLAFIDPSTGTIQSNEYPDIRQCAEILSRLPVHECVYPAKSQDEISALFRHPLLKSRPITLSAHEDWCFNHTIAHKNLCEHFGLPNLRGFGIEDLPAAVSSAGALLEYLRQMNQQPLKHIDRVCVYADNDFAVISPAAVYGLELATLFETINHTRCALGKRMLHFWLFHPLKNPEAILERQDAVTLLIRETETARDLHALLHQVPDLEKHLSRLSCGYTNARDLLALRHTLSLLPSLIEILGTPGHQHPFLRINDIPNLRRRLEEAINPEMPLTKYEGKVFQKGFHAGLDELRDIQTSGREWLKNFQRREIERTGINSLKIGFNKVFGYYIEITRTHLDAVPRDYIRKQTLVNAERFITQELKEYEDKILTAQDRIQAIEDELICQLRREILDQSAPLHNLARELGTVDALVSLAVFARQTNAVAPQIDSSTVIDIRDGRHPVVERSLETAFVPNDILLNGDNNHLIILTGPNMAGKSTYIRQIAILVILAQMGSWIPAASARIGSVDKIFTRIGAHDDIARGQSTFMVEMNETADILNNLSERSLVILDEIGRGTSTYDGLSLAWALAEHLQASGVRTCFATHFHELTALADDYPGVKNYNVAVKEWEDEVIFLHKIIPGGTDDSYGIYVAKLAGIPGPIINRAKKILTKLETNQDIKQALSSSEDLTSQTPQMDFFSGAFDPAAAALRQSLEEVDLNQMAPIEALMFLNTLKKKLNEGPDAPGGP